MRNETKTSYKTKEVNRVITNCSLALAMSIVLLGSTGCQMFDRFRAGPGFNSPVVFAAVPSKDEIIAHLQSQNQRIEQLQSDVKVSTAGMPALRGTLAIERPDRLRMSAGLFGVSELGIDVGSNNELFWFWTKVAPAGEQPAVYFARHNEYQASMLQRSLPIEPRWVIDALGLLEFNASDRIEGPFQRPDGRLELRTYRSVGGQPTVNITVIDSKFGWVVQQSVYDSQGRRRAYADSKSHEYYPEYQVSLPGLIVFTTNAPDGSEMQLTINASRYRINSIYGDPEKLWTMPNPPDVPQINLVDLANSQGPPISAASGQSSIHNFTQPSETGIANRSFIRNLR